MVHGHGPTHSNRQLDCDRLVVFVIFMRTLPIHYYLNSSESMTDLQTHPK